SVELLQTGARIAKPESLRGEHIAVGGGRAVVSHRENDPLATAVRLDLYAADATDLADPVLDGVLDEGLQDQVRHERVPHFGRHPHMQLQTALEADAHDLEIALEERQLLLERDLLLARAFERAAQKL